MWNRELAHNRSKRTRDLEGRDVNQLTLSFATQIPVFGNCAFLDGEKLTWSATSLPGKKDPDQSVK